MASSSRERVDDGLTSQSLADPEAIHADSEAIHDLIGSSQFSLLTLLGLREHQTLLDIGYASIRGAKLFILYLAPGNYYVVEPNTGLTEDRAAKEIGQGQLAAKRPTFSDDADFTLTTFGRTFDFLLADGIFSHASQRQIARFLSQARLVMKPESVLVATFNVWRSELGQKEEDREGDAWSDAGDVCYTWERMTELAAEHGLQCQPLAWQHPAGLASVLFTRPWWPGTIPRSIDPMVTADPVPLVPSATADPVLPAAHPESDPSPSVDTPSPVTAQPPTSHDPAGDEPAVVSRPTPIVAIRPRGAGAPRAPDNIAHTDRDLRILVEGVGVRYSAPSAPSLSLKEYVIRRLQGQPGERGFWALNGVGLTIRRGEVVGIIGRNGAGKSTLLKAVSRVLRPTVGRIVVRGWVTPLLELGAGFHGEQTGRENVYLNATLLGHSRHEVDAAIDAIVDFSELRPFLDAPVRTYSTGMVARLGFAIATAWNPDILILDEILGVGDNAFQQKCARRVSEMQEHASTVLLVSHSMDSIRKMCQRVIWIDHGTVRADGPTEDVIAQYRNL